MNTEHAFEPAGRAALHCEALLTHRLTDDDRMAAFGSLGSALASDLAARVGQLTGARCEGLAEPPAVHTTTVFARAAEAAGGGKSLHAIGQTGATLHLAVLPSGLEAAVARMFGGSPGSAPADSTPLSQVAQLLRDRVVVLGGDALTGQFATGAPLRIVARGLSAMITGPSRAKIASLSLAIHGAGDTPLAVLISVREDMVTAMLGARRKARTPAVVRAPAAAPWGDIALPVRAVLADTALPLSRITALAVGDTLMLPINRRVPLQCGGQTLAWGSVGDLDDRVALRVTETAMLESLA